MSKHELIAAILSVKPIETDIDHFGKHLALFSEYGYKKPLAWPQPYQWVWIKQKLIQEDAEMLKHLLALCK